MLLGLTITLVWLVRPMHLSTFGGDVMNADILAGKWKQLKGRVKEQWADLTDDDLTKAEGNYDKLVGTIQERYGYARDRAKAEVDAWMNGLADVR
jgi:uncharacterized protein YjbJ (UPF0337 family)